MMEITLSKMLCVIAFVFANITISSQDLYITDVTIDNVRLKNGFADYSKLFNCDVIKVVDNYNDNDIFIEFYERFQILDCDSIIINELVEVDKKPLKNKFTNYIEIISSKHIVKIGDVSLHVGMTSCELEVHFPELIKKYYEFLEEKEKNIEKVRVYNIQLLFESQLGSSSKYHFCQGLKFRIQNNLVVSIIVDFRTDGSLR